MRMHNTLDWTLFEAATETIGNTAVLIAVPENPDHFRYSSQKISNSYFLT